MELALVNGKIALIDDEDHDLVSAFSWYADRNRSGDGDGWYVRTSCRRHIRMHRLILDAKAGQVVDHANGNGLDNRRSNIRIATTSLNNANQKTRARFGYRGVFLQHAKFAAVIGGINKRHLGSFRTLEEAARAYDNAARATYGEFARLNFPRPGERSARRTNQPHPVEAA